MQIRAAAIANLVAWTILAGLIALALVMAAALGPFGLVLLGLMTLFVCTSVELREESPTWGVEVFRARQRGDTGPELHGAARHERRRLLGELRFYRWCGVVLLAAGAAGFAWQQWQ